MNIIQKSLQFIANFFKRILRFIIQVVFEIPILSVIIPTCFTLGALLVTLYRMIRIIDPVDKPTVYKVHFQNYFFTICNNKDIRSAFSVALSTFFNIITLPFQIMGLMAIGLISAIMNIFIKTEVNLIIDDIVPHILKNFGLRLEDFFTPMRCCVHTLSAERKSNLSTYYEPIDVGIEIEQDEQNAKDEQNTQDTEKPSRKQKKVHFNNLINNLNVDKKNLA